MRYLICYILVILISISCSVPSYIKTRIGCNKCDDNYKLSNSPLVFSDENDIIYLDTNCMFYSFFIDTMLYEKQNTKKTIISYNSPYFYRGWQGRYKVFNDTLHIQSVYNPGIANTWMAIENWYKIVNNNTVKLIAYRWISYDRENIGRNFSHELIQLESPRTYNIIELPVKVQESQNWLLKKRWFWCDKKEYKAWKKEMRKRKKHN